MKTTKFLAPILSATLLLTCLTACGGDPAASGTADTGVITVANSPSGIVETDNRTPLEDASGFTFDFETMEYAFTGAENAEFYYIRVFSVENGAESNSAVFQSDKIDANSSNSYSGTIQGQELLAGDYTAHVVASASGYSSSDIQISGTSAMQGNPTVSATWNTGNSGGGFPGMPSPEPAADEPGTDEPDVGEPDVGEPDVDEPGAGEPDVGEPDANEPDAGEPDVGEPDANEPGAGEPDAGEPAVSEPATGDSSTVTADISITAADESITKSYTLVVTDASGAEVYRNDSVMAGSLNLTAVDLGAAELSTEDVYNVTVTVNQESGYKVPAEGVTVQITEQRGFGGPPM